MELWNTVCKRVSEYKLNNVVEDVFQQFIEDLFAELGWSKIRKEIVPQESLPIGSSNYLIPDIIIKSNDENLFVVELKRPSAEATGRHEEQLISYMLQLKLTFGIYIGEVIKVFYDNPDDNKRPSVVTTIPFTTGNVDGEELFDVIKEKNYSPTAITLYCENKLKELSENDIANQLVSSFTKPGGDDNVNKKLLEELCDYIKSEYNDNIADKINEWVSIRVIDERSPNLTSDDNDNFVSSILASSQASLDGQNNNIELSNKIAVTVLSWLDEWEKDGFLHYRRSQNKNWFVFYTDDMDKMLPDYNSHKIYYYWLNVRLGEIPHMVFELINPGLPTSLIETENEIVAMYDKKIISHADKFRRIKRWNINNMIITPDSDYEKTMSSLKTEVENIIKVQIPALEKNINEKLF